MSKPKTRVDENIAKYVSDALKEYKSIIDQCVKIIDKNDSFIKDILILKEDVAMLKQAVPENLKGKLVKLIAKAYNQPSKIVMDNLKSSMDEKIEIEELEEKPKKKKEDKKDVKINRQSAKKS